MAENVVNDEVFRNRYLDVLYELKFKLSIKKIEGNITIPKFEFVKMIEEETKKDQEVRDAIDDLFKPLDLFNKRGKQDSKIVQDWKNESPVSLDYAQSSVDTELMKNSLGGPTLSKTLPQFKNKNNDKPNE